MDLLRATTISVARRFKDSKGVEEQNKKFNRRRIEVRKLKTAPALVGIGYGLTLNLGNFESARIDVSVSVPAYAEEYKMPAIGRLAG